MSYSGSKSILIDPSTSTTTSSSTVETEEIKKMTDAEIVDLLRSDTLLIRIRKIFYHESARIDQACAQRKPPTVIETRRMELLAAAAIIKEVHDTINGRVAGPDQTALDCGCAEK